MKYLVVKPRKEAKLGEFNKEFIEFDANKIADLPPFIEQHVGKKAVKRYVGDYVFWISDPNTVRNSESGQEEIIDTITLTPNLMVNESEIAYGSVVITANKSVGTSETEGLTDVDIGYIMNAFTMSGAVLVDQEELNDPVAVDRVSDNILSPNGVSSDIFEDIVPEIIEMEEVQEDFTEVTVPTDDIYNV